MDVDRRGLMKGMLASGALLAFGVPTGAFARSPARTPTDYVLLLGDLNADDAFATGARAACAARGFEGLRVTKLKDSVLTETDIVYGMVSRSRGTRWIAVLDDAEAVIFQEVIRTIGVRLFSIGSHASVDDGSCRIRHDWLVASPVQGAAGLLASHMIKERISFSITERCLKDPGDERTLKGWAAPGFSSYRVSRPDAMHLHCSDLSLAEGCRWIGLVADDEWTPIPPEACRCEAVSWRSRNWAESVGYAVTAKALGVATVGESCSGRAFVHDHPHGHGQRQPMDRFVSFVLDV
ncbi:hypothetical protein [Candidatus Nitrospira bockiana]